LEIEDGMCEIKCAEDGCSRFQVVLDIKMDH